MGMVRVSIGRRRVEDTEGASVEAFMRFLEGGSLYLCSASPVL